MWVFFFFPNERKKEEREGKGLGRKSSREKGDLGLGREVIFHILGKENAAADILGGHVM